jgi:hypothetical protein
MLTFEEVEENYKQIKWDIFELLTTELTKQRLETEVKDDKLREASVAGATSFSMRDMLCSK